MPAYARRSIGQFVIEDAHSVVGCLNQAYAEDGFASQYTSQTRAWAEIIPRLQVGLAELLKRRADAGEWQILFEFPLYRLRRRIDIVFLIGESIFVVETKVGATAFTGVDRRQVEEYALDLRDFHSGSNGRSIFPILWSTEAIAASGRAFANATVDRFVAPVAEIGQEGLQDYLASLPVTEGPLRIFPDLWDRSSYRPVPNVIDAATSIFAGHDVRSIANSDADNLHAAAARLLSLIEQARTNRKRYLLVLTGVPGSGKTLAGLHVVHSAAAQDRKGDIVYLSGNTPLVTVLREALALDVRNRRRPDETFRSIGNIRRDVRARIQHINDFLQDGLRGSSYAPPHEHVIVFDEAQRAWDEKHGSEKFDRADSEPSLLLELMSRHRDWCACVCLIGGGQEINSGEDGVSGWGKALRKMRPEDQCRWSIFAPNEVIDAGRSAGGLTLGEIPSNIEINVEGDLQLRVPQRSYRSPNLAVWVDNVLLGDAISAEGVACTLREYPLAITRSLLRAKAWLRDHGRGERRYGLVACSGARRLRAEGLGATLQAADGDAIAQWYLKPVGDIRSSFALEVPANEYTCQGLELDFTCLCWGGDLVWDPLRGFWNYKRLSGTSWQNANKDELKRFITNSYRVLLTRAREGLIIWIPEGDESDPTRAPCDFDSTARFLERCGAVCLDSGAQSVGA